MTISSTPLADPAPPPWSPMLLFSLCLSMLLSALGSSLGNVALPALAQAWRAPFALVQWVALGYLLTLTALSVSVGRLSDSLGRRRLLLAGIAVFSIGSALCAAAPSLPMLIAARALQGLGAACMMALSMAGVSDWAPAGRAGRAMGWLGSLSAVGSTLGPSLGGGLIAWSGWPAMFWLSAALGALTWLLSWRILPADRPRHGPAAPFDGQGALWLALALVCYALAGAAGFTLSGLAWLAAMLLATAGLVWRQGRAPASLIPLPLLRHPALRAGLLGSLLVSTVMMATLVVGPFYLTFALGLTPGKLGLAVALGPLAAALASAPAGRLVDRFGAPRVAGGGLCGLAVGAALLALLPLSSGLAGYLLPIVSMTVSYALFQTANNTAVMQCAAPQQRGVLAGLLNVSRNLGLTSGAALMGALFAWGVGNSDMAHAAPEAVAAGMRLTFAVAVAMVGLAGWRSMGRWPDAGSQTPANTR